MSLLQPGPETFSLFDEVKDICLSHFLRLFLYMPPTPLSSLFDKVILLAKGCIIYAGPVDEVVDYFDALGYRQMNTIDVADFLQSVATPDGLMFFNAKDGEEHYCASKFAGAFRSSLRHKEILAQLSSPLSCNWNVKQKVCVEDEESPEVNSTIPAEIKQQYKNSFWISVNLNLKRHLTLLKRDKEFLIGKTIENCGMGVGMALIFLQSAAFPSSFNESDKVVDYMNKGCPASETDEIGARELSY